MYPRTEVLMIGTFGQPAGMAGLNDSRPDRASERWACHPVVCLVGIQVALGPIGWPFRPEAKSDSTLAAK